MGNLKIRYNFVPRMLLRSEKLTDWQLMHVFDFHQAAQYFKLLCNSH